MEVHNCIHCGTESQPTWRFCRRCGTALENLEQQPAVANCSNCSSPVAAGWRFCANCGTGTDSAKPAAAGLSEDDVADLIATPGTDVVEDAATSEVAATPDAEPPGGSTPVAATDSAPGVEEEELMMNVADVATEEAAVGTDGLTPEAPVADVPAPQAAPVDHTISEPEVSFEPAAAEATQEKDDQSGAPPAAAAADVVPPPPPPDPLIDAEDIAAARAEAEAPPAAPVSATGEPITEIIEPADDPFVGTIDVAEAVEVGEEVVVVSADDTPEPTITIPRDDDEREIRSGIPRPISGDAPTEVPRPIEIDREERAPAAQETPKRRVAVPDQAPDRAGGEEEDLPALDGRFRNPGLFGQAVQLLLLVSAALSVAMMVSLIVLNNRLDSYATTGESLSRVQSAESMVNTWMRPLLIVAIVITYALLAMWSRRVLTNLHAFNNGMDETPLWMWMMPFVNMWVLFRHLDLAWKGSDYYARGARTWQRSIPDVWTVLFVLLPTLGFVLVLFGWVSGADTFQMAIDSNAFSMVGYCAIAIGLLAGVRSITNIIERQRTRAEGIR